MSDLVLLHHNEPMTTSETLAAGVELQHKNVVALIRKHVADLAEWGEIAFQTRFNPQGKPTEFAWLNEGQSLFLLTLMKNSPIVVAFKKALVKAFLELRDRLAVPPAPTFGTSNVSHGADLAVAADRTFRSFLRAARSAGMKLPAALKVANRHTVERTGLDMLAALGVAPEEPAPDALATALSAWADTAEAGKHYALEAVLCDVAGVTPRDRHFWREMARAGDILRGLGFRRVRIRHAGRQAALWIKEAA